MTERPFGPDGEMIESRRELRLDPTSARDEADWVYDKSREGASIVLFTAAWIARFIVQAFGYGVLVLFAGFLVLLGCGGLLMCLTGMIIWIYDPVANFGVLRGASIAGIWSFGALIAGVLLLHFGRQFCQSVSAQSGAFRPANSYSAMQSFQEHFMRAAQWRQEAGKRRRDKSKCFEEEQRRQRERQVAESARKRWRRQ